MGLILNSLPNYSGPYKVSTHDFEFFPSSSTSTSTFSFSRALLCSTNSPALELDTILFTTFYPTNPHTTNTNTETMDWLERPLKVTSQGYSKFLNKPNWLIKTLIYLSGAKNLKLPATSTRIDQPLLNLNENENGSLFPVVIFSHGLSGNRITYSQFCGELASRGFVVIALEHRDGSGPVSIVKLNHDDGDKKQKIVDYIKENDIYYENDQDKVPFLEFRRHQIEFRKNEIFQTLEILNRINETGDTTKELERSNLRRRNRSDSLLFEWKNWKGKLDLKNNLIMAGHSFGGATTIEILRSNEKFGFNRGLALDPWVEPLPPSPEVIQFETTTPTTTKQREGVASSAAAAPAPVPTSSSASSPSSSSASGEEEKRGKISVPFLVINSEAFTLWKPHFYQVKKIVESVQEKTQTWFFTILGSIHISFSDIPLFLPKFLTPKKATTPALESHGLIMEIVTEFIEKRFFKQDGKYLGRQELKFKGDCEFMNFKDRGEREEEGEKKEKGPLKKEEGEGFVRLHLKK
ncbi:hypothetical protein JCM3765_004641 [Sporobolomyces pararoseus]